MTHTAMCGYVIAEQGSRCLHDFCLQALNHHST
jgi:hypothetical protein